MRHRVIRSQCQDGNETGDTATITIVARGLSLRAARELAALRQRVDPGSDYSCHEEDGKL